MRTQNESGIVIEEILKKVYGKSEEEIIKEIENFYEIGDEVDIDFFNLCSNNLLSIDGYFTPDDLRQIADAQDALNEIVQMALREERGELSSDKKEERSPIFEIRGKLFVPIKGISSHMMEIERTGLHEKD